MINKVELRVHTGASSSRADDDGYRVQAQSYLQARYHASTSWQLKMGADGSRATTSEGITSEDMASSRIMNADLGDNTVTYDVTTYVEDTQLAYTALESQVVFCSQPVKSSRASTERTRERSFATHILPNTEHDEPSGTDPEDSQSSYMKTPILDGSTKRRRIERIAATPTTSRRTEGPYIANAEQREIGISCLGSPPAFDAPKSGHDRSIESHDTNDVTSELPSSYSLSNITSGSSKSRRHASQRSTSDPGLRSPDTGQPTLVARPRSSPQVLNTKNPSHLHNQPTEKRDGLISIHPQQAHRSTSPEESIIPYSGERRTDIRTSQGNVREAQPELSELDRSGDSFSRIRSLPLSIRPPEPSVSVDGFTTHITPLLDSLARLEVARAYRPVSVSRDVRIWERGHWLVDATSWDIDAQVSFWGKLQEYIGGGSCGWGVWCTRDCSESMPHGDPCLDIVRVFCWGEVVRHIYLLLYSISMSKVRLLGLKWLDAEEQVVVQMRGLGSCN